MIARTLADLVEVVREEDPDRLVTYANYPTAEYLPLESLDFLTFNVFLERRPDFRRYLTRLHHLAGDRPLVLGRAGSSARGRPRASVAGRGPRLATRDGHRARSRGHLRVLLDRRVVGGRRRRHGWRFGLHASRSLAAAGARGRQPLEPSDGPRRRLRLASDQRRDLRPQRRRDARRVPASRLRARLSRLEVIVVDDGSTDATAAIAARYHRGLLVSHRARRPCGGAQRGLRSRQGRARRLPRRRRLSDPRMALLPGARARRAGRRRRRRSRTCRRWRPVGRPRVARSPGGPVHVLTSDDRAEHVPGLQHGVLAARCSRRSAGFDPVYTAGDDVDICWKVARPRLEIGFHPAAVVWHHRRPGVRAYLRQQRRLRPQRGAGRGPSSAPLHRGGTARWRGRIYNSLTPPLRRQRIYRGRVRRRRLPVGLPGRGTRASTSSTRSGSRSRR